MKIIEGMKKIKELEIKAKDLRDKVFTFCADMDYETPVYGDEATQRATVSGWVQAHRDIVKEILDLRVAIQRTNLATEVEIEVTEGKTVKKTIAEWIHRRVALAPLEREMISRLGAKEKMMKETPLQSSTGTSTPTKIRRYYEPAERDALLEEYTSEPMKIDARLEVVNAVTDLI
jgi:hypothetical protein